MEGTAKWSLKEHVRFELVSCYIVVCKGVVVCVPTTANSEASEKTYSVTVLVFVREGL